jgi:hypothetical protein
MRPRWRRSKKLPAMFDTRRAKLQKKNGGEATDHSTREGTMRLRCSHLAHIGLGVFVAFAPVTAAKADDGGAMLLRPDPNLPPSAPAVRTGKERLGGKWMDEQRVDNCKVPIDKRGTKLRPEACTNVPTQ